MSSFPSITSLEPPPLDSTSEDEDSFEFRTPAGLKLDLQSADPSPLSTPRKSSKPKSTSPLPIPQITTSTSDENGHSDGDIGVNHWDSENLDIEEDEDFKDCEGEDGDIGEIKKVQSPTGTLSDLKQIPETAILSQLEVEGQDISQAPEEELELATDYGVEGESCVEEPETVSSSEVPEDQISSVVVDDIPEASDDDFQLAKVVEKEEQDSSSSDSERKEETFLPDEDGFGDFAVFQTSDRSATPVAEGGGDNNVKDTLIPPEEEFKDEDDDFGDFSSNSFQSAPQPQQPQLPVLLDPGGVDELEEDDFQDFANFQAMPATSTSQELPTFRRASTSSRSSADFTAALESRFDTLIKAVIPTPSSVSEDVPEASPHPEESSPSPGDSPPLETTTCNLTLIEKELSETKDCCWGHTVDFEDSRALLHKWPQSSSQQRFYQSLKIDTSTIVYTEKWGAIEVPRCAAGMVEKPILQPQVVSSSSRTNEYDSPQPVRKSSSNQEDNPIISNGKPPQQLSLEAQRIIQKIPDISYMTSKTLVFPQTPASSSNSLL